MIDWLAIIVATRRQHHQRHLQRGGTEHKERIGSGSNRAVDHDGGLARVVEHEGGKHQAVPSEPDRSRPEVTHVGVERLGAGGAQEHRTKNKKTRESVPQQVIEPMARVEGHQHARMS